MGKMHNLLETPELVCHIQKIRTSKRPIRGEGIQHFPHICGFFKVALVLARRNARKAKHKVQLRNMRVISCC